MIEFILIALPWLAFIGVGCYVAWDILKSVDEDEYR